MRVDILDHWQDLIEAAEALDVGDNPLYIDFDDQEVFESGVMAMVIYKSRLCIQRAEYTFELDTDGLALEIQKVYSETVVRKK